LIVHQLDNAWPGIQSRLEEFFLEGFVDELVILTVPSSEELPQDPEIGVVKQNINGLPNRETETLFGYLAKLGNIDGIRLCAIRCDASGQITSLEESIQLDRALKRISSTLMKFASNKLPKKEVRIAIIGEEERAPGSPFFSPNADANVIVIPRDVSMSMSVAKPVVREQRVVFEGHAAMELASILGMWTVMKSAPVDTVIRKPLGVEGYAVTFMKSRVKGLVAPPLPIGDLINDADLLPIPTGFAPVDNLEVVVERYAEGIYPSNMHFSSIPAPNSHEYVKFIQLIKAYAIEFLNTVRSLPRIIRSGFDNEIEQVGQLVLDNLIGGSDARIRPLISSQGRDNPDGLTEDRIEELIRDIEYRDDRPVVGALTSDEWADLATRILGIADGNDEADSHRELVMPSNILVREKSALAPRVASVAELVRSVMPPHLKHETFEHEPLVQTTDVPSEDDSAESEIEPFQSPVVVGDIDLMALREAIRSSGINRPEEAINHDLENDEFNQNYVSNFQTPTLIGHVTKIFDREFNKAENASFSSLSELRELPKKLISRDSVKISLSVIVAVCLSIGVLIASAATHGVVREIFGLEWLSAKSRDFLWLGLSSILLVISVSILFSTGNRTWQRRTMVLTAICSAVVAIEYFSFGWLRERLSGNSISLKIASVTLLLLAGIVLVVLNLLIGFLAIYRSTKSNNLIRQKIGRGMALLIWAYLVVGISSFLAGPVSFVNTWEDSTRHRFLLACQFVGWICLLMAMLVVVSIRVKQQNSFGIHADRFRWAQENVIHSIDARRYLRTAYTQWLLVGAALSRIIWHPLGQKASESTPFQGRLAVDDAILKFDIAMMELSEEGRTSLLAKLTKMFVRQGWLSVQFNYAVEEFKSTTAILNGNGSEDHNPFACPAVPPISDVLNDDARGDRFQFAKKLYEGELDEVLLASATNNNLDSVYSEILRNERLHVVTNSQHNFATADQFLTDILPGETSTLPSELVNKLFSAGDGLMTTHLWWPKTSILKRPQVEVANLHESTGMIGSELNDSVLLMAVMVEVSDQYRDDEVSVVVNEHVAVIKPPRVNDW
jgi:uncharacterized membrane protein YozB (DUF420 family)